MTRVLDYVPRLDDRNRGHRIRASLLDGEVLAVRPRFWVPGPVLDQGREGACVGFGCTAEALASPVRVRLRRPFYSDGVPESEAAA